MSSIGLDLERHRRAGLLRLHTARPSLYGLESHLAALQQLVDDHTPSLVVIDPINDLVALGTTREVLAANIRLIDLLKGRGITAVFTAMGELDPTTEAPELGVSSLMDTWIGLFTMRYAGERNRCVAVLKSRGTGHSNQLREFLITDHGLDLVETYVGGGEVLTGSARLAQAQRERIELDARSRDAQRQRRDLELQQRATRAQIEALGAELSRIDGELGEALRDTGDAEAARAVDRGRMSRLREYGVAVDGRTGGLRPGR